jgi:hypothetical protein
MGLFSFAREPPGHPMDLTATLLAAQSPGTPLLSLFLRYLTFPFVFFFFGFGLIAGDTLFARFF